MGADSVKQLWKASRRRFFPSEKIRISLTGLVLAACVFTTGFAQTPPTVQLVTSLPSGQPVGIRILLFGVAEGVPAGQLPLYQFSTRAEGEGWRMRRDFAESSEFIWSSLNEGNYELRVQLRLLDSELVISETIAESTIPFLETSRVTGQPAVVATTHPLIALYSAPACLGGQVWLRFRRIGTHFWTPTFPKPCNNKSLNFYVAGMRPNSNYQVQQLKVGARGLESGPILDFRTGIPEVNFALHSVIKPPDEQTSWAEPILLLTPITDPVLPFAMDLGGKVVWYLNLLSGKDPVITRPLPGGNMLVISNTDFKGQVLQEADVAGNVIRETSTLIVNQQLTSMGHDSIGSFHHDAIRLPNGHTLVITSVERILTDVQGPGPVNVYGEMILDLDENFQVVWAWNSFDHLDPGRVAILGEVCESEGPGCPPLFNGSPANDWLHANSLNYVPTDGSILMSMRHQDWVIKIDYQHGTGTGNVLWRLGEGGDFAFRDSIDPWPWFSHQHDARMFGTGMVLFDNGNTRVEGPNGIGGNSRGQVLIVDENTREVRFMFNFDLGAYSFALGNAQPLSNGNYHFNNGFLGGANPSAVSVGVTPTSGLSTFVSWSEGPVYRSFRLKDMYRPGF